MEPKSQYDGKINVVQNCFGDYTDFDIVWRKCSICSVRSACRQKTKQIKFASWLRFTKEKI